MKKMTTLLIIGRYDLLNVLERSFLRRDGFRLVGASTGQLLVGLAAQESPDLVVCTTDMEDESGFAVCASVRAIRDGAIPVLLVGKEAERERARAAGASAYLAAPWSARDLLAAVRAQLGIEDRGASRAPVSVPVVCGEGASRFVAFTRDISATGLFLKGGAPLELGHRMRIHLKLPGEPSSGGLDVAAVVVRRVAGGGSQPAAAGLGLQFVDVPLIRKVPITRFVREHAVE